MFRQRTLIEVSGNPRKETERARGPATDLPDQVPLKERKRRYEARRARELRESDPERYAAYLKYHANYSAANKERKKKVQAAFREAHREEYNRRASESRKRNADRIQLKYIQRRRKLRAEALRAYGGDPPVCVGCGEEDEEVLTLDHVNNDGRRHREGMYLNPRRTRPGSGGNMYGWLKGKGWPKEPAIRILCANCQLRHVKRLPLPNEIEHGATPHD